MSALYTRDTRYNDTMNDLIDNQDRPFAKRADRRITERHTAMSFSNKRFGRLAFVWQED